MEIPQYNMDDHQGLDYSTWESIQNSGGNVHRVAIFGTPYPSRDRERTTSLNMRGFND